MKRRKKQKINIEYIAIAIILIFVILIIISITNMFKKTVTLPPKDMVNVSTENNISLSKQVEDAEIEKLDKMTERSRIEYYVSKFMKNVEYKDYSAAYDMLNSNFKKNYFPSVKDLREYCEKNFSTMMNIEYSNFERNGDIYVCWLKITDAVNGTRDSGKEINFVVKENSLNDFELSFSAN